MSTENSEHYKDLMLPLEWHSLPKLNEQESNSYPKTQTYNQFKHLTNSCLSVIRLSLIPILLSTLK
jgi:hypothetical protein